MADKAAVSAMADKSPVGAVFADFKAGLVVFLVALPLCLGVALASRSDKVPEAANVPLFAGLISGVLGGILVGVLSGSRTSVSGPAAGLTAVVAAQLTLLGSFQTFLLAVMLAGLIQIGLGVARAGFIASFFPSSVIKGLLAAIGVILILKQIPHVVGHDPDPEGDMAFDQPDRHSTFGELLVLADDFQYGAAAIGLASILIMVVWDRWKLLKYSPVPVALVVVVFGVAMRELFRRIGEPWAIDSTHLVQVPVADTFEGFLGFLQFPDFMQLGNRAVYVAAFTIAIVASLETLLNLEAVDKIDPRQRQSPPSRELIAQGVGNTVSGLIGGLPITSVIVRSSVNIHAGARSKISTIVHGALLLGSIALLPAWLNLIPLSCLAAILLMTGIKLASPKLLRESWKAGWNQFVPFIATVVAIVFTDLLIGVVIGLVIALANILRSNVRRPLRTVVEKHIGGTVTRIALANQVSFLNRAALETALHQIPSGGHVLLDAQSTDYIDPDILELIRDFKDDTAPIRGVEVSLVGFREKYRLEDRTQFVDYSTRELQSALTPLQILEILREGHQRFRASRPLTRDYTRQMIATAEGQHPLAVIVSCIDSRTPAELLFDVGVGDIFSIRLAGNVSSRKVLGSAEYACAVAGAKLILVLGHTRCGAVTATIEMACSSKTPKETTGCDHVGFIVDDIRPSIGEGSCANFPALPAGEKRAFVDAVARRNVLRTVETILKDSGTLRALVYEGKIAVVGALYDVATGDIEYLVAQGVNVADAPAAGDGG